jgi:hypothetical protein
MKLKSKKGDDPLAYLKREPSIYQTFGGLRGALQQGIQKQDQFLKDIEARNTAYNFGQQHGEYTGFVKGKNVGYVEGLKDFMVEGDKYIVTQRDSPQPLFASTSADALKLEVGGKKISDLVADNEHGKFENSKYFQKFQNASTLIKQTTNYEENLQKVNDQLFSSNEELNELKNAIEKTDKAIQQNYQELIDKFNSKRKIYTEHTASHKFSKMIGGFDTAPVVMSDDWNLYNVDAVRLYKDSQSLRNDLMPLSDPLAKKYLDYRTGQHSFGSTNIRDYISRPGQDFSTGEESLRTKAEQAGEWIRSTQPKFNHPRIVSREDEDIRRMIRTMSDSIMDIRRPIVEDIQQPIVEGIQHPIVEDIQHPIVEDITTPVKSIRVNREERTPQKVEEELANEELAKIEAENLAAFEAEADRIAAEKDALDQKQVDEINEAVNKKNEEDTIFHNQRLDIEKKYKSAEYKAVRAEGAANTAKKEIDTAVKQETKDKREELYQQAYNKATELRAQANKLKEEADKIIEEDDRRIDDAIRVFTGTTKIIKD